MTGGHMAVVATQKIQFEAFTDPITLEPLEDPYLHKECSKDFNYTSVLEFVEQHKKCPWCSKNATLEDFIPNRTLKNGLEEMQRCALRSIDSHLNSPRRRENLGNGRRSGGLSQGASPVPSSANRAGNKEPSKIDQQRSKVGESPSKEIAEKPKLRESLPGFLSVHVSDLAKSENKKKSVTVRAYERDFMIDLEVSALIHLTLRQGNEILFEWMGLELSEISEIFADTILSFVRLKSENNEAKASSLETKKMNQAAQRPIATKLDFPKMIPSQPLLDGVPCIGQGGWKEVFGSVGTEPAIKNIKRSSIDHPVHLLIPKVLNGKRLNLNHLIELCESVPFLKGKISIDPLVKKQYGDMGPRDPYWIESSLTLLKGSRGSPKNIHSALDLYPTFKSPTILEALSTIIFTRMRIQSKETGLIGSLQVFTTVCQEHVNTFQEGLFGTVISKLVYTPASVTYFPITGKIQISFIDSGEFENHVGTFACRKL